MSIQVLQSWNRLNSIPTRWALLLLAGIAYFALPNLQTRGSETRSQNPSHPGSHFTAAQCASCHQMKGGFSHPVNVPVPAAAPAELPRSNGMLTCLTCHESSVDAHRASRTNGDMLLRSENAVSLCASCHDPDDASRTSQHALAVGSAHLGNRKAAGSAALYLETNNCLTCHDGLISTDTAMSELRRPGDALEEHPVGVPYRNSRSATEVPVVLNPASHLDPGIRLFDGQVGCGSCHSPYSTQPKLLVMSNLHGRLCLGCHKQ